MKSDVIVAFSKGKVKVLRHLLTSRLAKAGRTERISTANLYSITVIGLTDSNTACGAAQENYRKLSFGSYGKIPFL